MLTPLAGKRWSQSGQIFRVPREGELAIPARDSGPTGLPPQSIGAMASADRQLQELRRLGLGLFDHSSCAGSARHPNVLRRTRSNRDISKDIHG